MNKKFISLVAIAALSVGTSALAGNGINLSASGFPDTIDVQIHSWLGITIHGTPIPVNGSTGLISWSKLHIATGSKTVQIDFCDKTCSASTVMASAFLATAADGSTGTVTKAPSSFSFNGQTYKIDLNGYSLGTAAQNINVKITS